MGKQIRILVVRQSKTKKLVDDLKRKGQKMGILVDVATWKEVIVDTATSQKESLLQVKGRNLTDYDLVYVGTIGTSYYEMVQLTTACRALGIRVVDKSLTSGSRVTDSKIYQLVTAKINGLAVPRTVFATAKTLVAEADRFGTFPLILKVMGLHRGQGVFLVKDKDHIRRIMEKYIEGAESKNFILQEKIDYQKDYRVFVLGEKVLGAIERIPKTGEFRANVSRGGGAKNIGLLPQKLEKMAIKATHVMKLDVAGVDFLETKEGDYLLLEVNRAPQYKGLSQATGINVREAILKYLKELVVKERRGDN